MWGGEGENWGGVVYCRNRIWAISFKNQWWGGGDEEQDREGTIFISVGERFRNSISPKRSMMFDL